MEQKLVIDESIVYNTLIYVTTAILKSNKYRQYSFDFNIAVVIICFSRLLFLTYF